MTSISAINNTTPEAISRHEACSRRHQQPKLAPGERYASDNIDSEELRQKQV